VDRHQVGGCDWASFAGAVVSCCGAAAGSANAGAIDRNCFSRRLGRFQQIARMDLFRSSWFYVSRGGREGEMQGRKGRPVHSSTRRGFQYTWPLIAVIFACSEEPVVPEPEQFHETTVWIQSFLRHNTSTSIQPSSLRGVVDIVFMYDMPIGVAVSGFRVTIGHNTLQGAEQEICKFGVTERRGGVVCVIDTAELDATTGYRKFPDGQMLLVGRMLGAGGTEVATARALVTISNP